VDEFLELTAIANPHAQISFVPPTRVSADDQEDLPLGDAQKDAVHAEVLDEAHAHTGEPASAGGAADVDPTITTIEKEGVVLFPRGTEQLPPETREIQPHPKGIELGILIQMMKDYESHHTRGGTLYHFLQEQFSRVSSGKSSDFCKAAGAHSRTKVCDLEPKQIEALFRAFQEAKLPAPPTDCLAPIGVRQMLAGLLKGVKAEFYAASSREPEVYRGRPFQIEAAIAFGGELPADDTARVIRFANRVPLLFQPSACSSFKAVTETGWRNYNLSQPRGSLPTGPLVIMIHMASVWVPFTSESKEAIADYDEIRKEMKLALMECGRKLGTYLRKRQKMLREAARRDVFERYIGEISKAVNAINGKWSAKELYEALLKEARKRTAIADAQLDDEGRTVKKDETEELKNDEGVVMVESRAAHLAEAENGAGEPASAGGSSSKNDDDLVPLKSRSKKRKPKKKPDEDGLF
jgi:DNA topoisomerase-6 subunit B